MIVCVCNAIREQEIRDVARFGPESAEAAYAELGCAPCCAQCLPYAEEILEEERRVHA